MNCEKFNTSTSENTLNKSQENSALSAKDTVDDMGWSQEQLEILQQCHEEKIANKKIYSSLLEPHAMMCNCVECN